jgi:hypothetical protein
LYCWELLLKCVKQIFLHLLSTYFLDFMSLHRWFENRVLKRVFCLKGDEVTGNWGKVHNEELHNLYSSPSIIRLIKSRRMRWAGNVERMGRKGMRETARNTKMYVCGQY